MADLAENLLSSIPVGEVIKDAREGEQPDAVLTSPELVDFGDSKAVKVIWNNLTDADGRSFQFQARYPLPTTDSAPWQHARFLDLVHGLGIVPRGQRNAINVDTEQDQETVLNAFKSIDGNNFPIRLYVNKKTGYLESRLSKKSK